MGVYSEKFRQLTDQLPKTPEDFANPIQAASTMAQLTNVTLQTIAALEEALEDLQKEKEKLEDLLMNNSKVMDPWKP